MASFEHVGLTRSKPDILYDVSSNVLSDMLWSSRLRVCIDYIESEPFLLVMGIGAVIVVVDTCDSDKTSRSTWQGGTSISVSIELIPLFCERSESQKRDAIGLCSCTCACSMISCIAGWISIADVHR